MKVFSSISFSPYICAKELEEFKDLLASKSELSEQKEILPFFRNHRHLSAFVASNIPSINQYDKVAFEYDLFGDFACDLVIGDSRSKKYLLVEFEDAKKNSLFKKKKGKVTPEWSPRLEHGFSQVLDWFWKLSDQSITEDFEHRFGSRNAKFHGLVVIGRSQHLNKREKSRLSWRQDHLLCDSKYIEVITFDDLAEDLEFKLNYSFAMKRASRHPTRK
ncbi:MAG: DUF4263 domain-containing protein [Sedimentisphaerales bacterium]|nr:DUF4263 domain-containing protein [Sedimentisphaerales bacterium]